MHECKQVGANFCIRTSNFSSCLYNEQVAVNKWENYARKFQQLNADEGSDGENDVINKKIFKRVTLNTQGVTLVLHLLPIQITPQTIGKV